MGNYYSIDYEIDETEAIAVRMIFKEYINGTGYIAICRMLNERGFKTRRGNDFSKGSLYEIITNRRYIGTAILGKNCMNKNGKRNSHRPDHSKMLIVENVCPPIIEKEIFEMAQKQRKTVILLSALYGVKNAVEHIVAVFPQGKVVVTDITDVLPKAKRCRQM